MWKLGRMGLRRNSRQRRRKLKLSKEGYLTEGDRRGGEGNTLMHMMCINKLNRVDHYADHGKEGRERE